MATIYIFVTQNNGDFLLTFLKDVTFSRKMLQIKFVFLLVFCLSEVNLVLCTGKYVSFFFLETAQFSFERLFFS